MPSSIPARDAQASTGSYREQLFVPLRWWVQATMLLASLWLAFIVAMPAAAAWGATGVVVALTVAGFLSAITGESVQESELHLDLRIIEGQTS